MVAPRPGSLVHVEFASPEPKRTRKFLEDVFAWRFETVPDLDYYPCAAATGPGGAVMSPTEEQPRGVLNYILSENIETDLQKIERAGGKVLGSRKEIPGVGWWALFEEPGGCTLALFQTRSGDRGPVARYR